MTEPMDYPAHETEAEKPVVGPAQGAVDATFNAYTTGAAEDVEGRLREELSQAGVQMPDDWVAETVEHIRAGEPVVVEVDEERPGR